ncbi:hypothetical protein N1031_14515 [Herbiconiux moechotypicola]|uniref:Acyl-CoA carboxylase subunit epsilon n=1 Tax=Herbiconiux moechotypicola TaxID=637393 RepID=A0ABN3DX82_9MICO|nr:acyl-CoA carboxylase epsilon subunit [Herbiconiux moechotypicola]MCS5730976.1 hypothetical protein [Herbiconiux moechotypicola]
MDTSTDDPADTPAIRVLTRSVTAEELAAVTAVVQAAVGDELDSLQHEVRIGPSAWDRSSRALRAPLRPGPDAWRGFSG